MLPNSLPKPRISSGVGEGWWPLILNLHDNIKEIDPYYRIDQIKEKYGTLRYYVTLSDDLPIHQRDYLRHMIAAAELTSASTCEECGSAGKQRTGSWIRTLCDKCYAGRASD